MRRTLLGIGISLVLGIVSIKLIIVFPIMYYIFYKMEDKKKFFVSLLIAFLIGSFLMSQKTKEFSDDLLLNYLEKNTIATMTVEEVEQKEEEKYYITCHVESIDGRLNQSKPRTLLVCLGKIDKPWELIGKELNQKITLELAKAQNNPRCFDYRKYLKTVDIGTIATIKTVKESTIQEKITLNDKIKQYIMHKKTDFEKTLKCDDKVKGIIKGVIFGDINSLDDKVYDEFKTNGTAHVLAVSGLHVGIIYLLYEKIFGKKKSIVGLTLLSLVLLLYGAVSLWSISITRAIILVEIKIVGQLLDRRYDLLTALAFITICFLVENPYQIYNAGFQMSFLAVISIVFIAPQLRKILPEYMSVIVAVQLGMIPYLAYTFNYVSILSLLCNIPIVYLITIFVPMGLGSFILFFTVGVYSEVFQMVLCSIGDFTIKLNSVLNFNEFFVVDIISLKLWALVGIYAMGFFICSEFFSVMIIRKDKKRIAMGAIGVFAIIIYASSISYIPFDRANMVFIDVGQGDAIEIMGNNGKTVLIDGGGNINYNIGQKVLKPYFLKNGKRNLSLAMATHLHTDHYLGIKELSQCFDVKNIIIEGKQGDKVNISKTQWIEILWPVEVNPNVDEKDENENMIVMKVYNEGYTALITGDLTEIGEKKILEEYKGTNKLKCDILKVGHHGSKYSTSDDFLEAVSPKIAVIQVGKNNYGHPAKGVLEKLQKKGIIVKRTDQNGAVGILYEKGHIKICTTMKKSTAL
ncbi:MAG: DNA internalization-related competence protein ComEC/Rec2 [Anaerovoracaceae bacterium]